MRLFCRLARCLRWRYLAACCLSTVVALVLLVGSPPPPPIAAAPLRSIYVLEPVEENSSTVANSSVWHSSSSRLAPPRALTQVTVPINPPVASKQLLSSPLPPNNSTLHPNTRKVPDAPAKKPPPAAAVVTKATTKQTTKATAKPMPTTTPPLVVGEVFSQSTLHASNPKWPLIYAVTPTYKRMEQMAELTRMSQTLMLVPGLHWIVVEDATQFNDVIRQLLRRTGLNFTHMLGPKPERFNRPPHPVITSKTSGNTKKKGPPPIPRGVSNRLAALRWVKTNVKEGVLYFADDDNTYDIRLFEEMRGTQKVSMWPVGLVTQYAISSPVVKDGKVVGFYDGWIAGRKFPVDMAGFAVSVEFLLQQTNVTMPFQVGYEEDGFLKSLKITVNDIEPKAKNCSQVLVWHTKTVKNNVPKKMSQKDVDKYSKTNIIELCRQIT